MARPLKLLSLGVGFSLLLTACSEDDTAGEVRTSTSATPTDPSSTSSSVTTASATSAAAPSTSMARAPAEASFETIFFVDESRPTPAGSQTDELPDRTIETSLYLPAAEDPAPLILFAHGIGGHPDKFSRMLGAWQDAGYAVAAPAFPLTNDRIPGAFQNGADVVNQPADTAFVLDQILALNDDEYSTVFERIDTEHIGAAGLSLGGVSTYAVAVDENTRDPRFDAVIIQASAIASTGFIAPTDLPVMIMHGADDPLIGIGAAEISYDRLGAPKMFVSMVGALHADQFTDPETALTPTALEFHPLVDEATAAFWDAYLREPPTATADEVVAAATDDRLTVVEAQLQ